MSNDAQYVHVRAETGKKKESVELVRKGRYRISVKVPAEQGRANERIHTLLAQALHLPEKSIRLIKGHTSPSKTYLLANAKDHEDQH